MDKRISMLSSAAALLAGAWLAGCAQIPVTREPANLSDAKAAVVRYHDEGVYERELAEVAAQARTWIEQRVAARKAGERLGVVFDIDETVLSNYGHMRTEDFGYKAEVWAAWVAKAEAPAIEPVREVFLTARRLGVAVVFITGRRDPRDRAGTEVNLARAGMGDYERLMMTPQDGRSVSAAVQKAEMRRAVVADGFTIIANLGDQQSDLSGGFSERTFKLPGPFYRID